MARKLKTKVTARSRWYRPTILTCDINTAGTVYLLPSNIEPLCIIQAHKSWAKTNLSIVTLLKPQARELEYRESARSRDRRGGLTAPETFTINTPHLIYIYDGIFNTSRYCGYIYGYTPTPRLSQSLKQVFHFFFPHIYCDGRLCPSSGYGRSPRTHLSNFFATPFTRDWNTIYHSKYYYSDESVIYKVNDYPKYIQSTDPALDKQNKARVSQYETLFELRTKDKPQAIFLAEPKLLEALDLQTAILKPTYGEPYVAGFAFFHNSDVYVYLKNETILKLDKSQVHLK